MQDTNKNDEDIMPLSPEEIKAIGEIELGPSKHEQFLNDHYKKLLWGGIALGICAGGVIAYFSHKNDRRQEASAVVVAAMKAEEPGKAASTDAFDAKSLETVRAQYGETPSAATAELLEGLSLLRTGGDTAAAISKLENVAATSKNPLLVSRAVAAVAAQYMTENRNDEALAAWKRVAELEPNPYTALAYICMGDLSKAAGDKAAARTYYETAKTKCPASALVRNRTADLRLTLLDVDAPVPTAPAAQADPGQGAAASSSAADTSWLNTDVGSSTSSALDSLPGTTTTTTDFPSMPESTSTTTDFPSMPETPAAPAAAEETPAATEPAAPAAAEEPAAATEPAAPAVEQPAETTPAADQQ